MKYFIAKWICYLLIKTLRIFFPSIVKIERSENPSVDLYYFKFTIDKLDYLKMSRKAYKQINDLNNRMLKFK